jgi:hypothetical protein
MKKILLMMVLILPLVFQSCKEDEEISLPGTEWIYELTVDDYEVVIILKFLDSNHFRMQYYLNGEENEAPEEGTYSLSGSEVTLLFEDGNTDKGNIKGNKIIFTNPEIPLIQIVLTKR